MIIVVIVCTAILQKQSMRVLLPSENRDHFSFLDKVKINLNWLILV